MQMRLLAPIRIVMLFRARQKVGPLIAQAAYENLPEEEERAFKHLAEAYPELNDERDAYAALAERVRLPEAELPFDLLPRLNHRLNEESANARVSRWAGVYVMAAAVALLAAGVYFSAMLFESTGVMNDMSAQSVARTLPPQTPLSLAVVDACKLVSASDAGVAADRIRSLIAAHPDDAYVGEAQLILADVEYTYLQRYDLAYAAYDALRAAFPQVFASSPEIGFRYDLLAEAQRENFAPLYALDHAREHPENAFVIYERLICQYPGTTLASAVMDEMRALVVAARATDGTPTMTEALELVRQRCADPVAIAQLDLALGDIYARTLNDSELARAHYMRASTSDHVALVHQAREALTRME